MSKIVILLQCLEYHLVYLLYLCSLDYQTIFVNDQCSIPKHTINLTPHSTIEGGIIPWQ